MGTGDRGRRLISTVIHSCPHGARLGCSSQSCRTGARDVHDGGGDVWNVPSRRNRDGMAARRLYYPHRGGHFARAELTEGTGLLRQLQIQNKNCSKSLCPTRYRRSIRAPRNHVCSPRLLSITSTLSIPSSSINFSTKVLMSCDETFVRRTVVSSIDPLGEARKRLI